MSFFSKLNPFAIKDELAPGIDEIEVLDKPPIPDEKDGPHVDKAIEVAA